MSRATSARAGALVWAAAWGAQFALLAWTRSFAPGWLIAGAALLGALALAWRLRPAPLRSVRGQWVLGASAVLAFALAVAGAAQWRFEQVEFAWEEIAQARAASLTRAVEQRTTELHAYGARAAEAGAIAAADSARFRLFAMLEGVRARHQVAALAVFSDAGELLAWAGEHRGALPERVRAGAPRTYFVERPLFSYLYLVRPVRGRAEHVVAAVLLETGVSAESDRSVSAPWRSDGRVSYHAGDHLPVGEPAWALVEAGDTVVSALVRPLTQSEVRADVERAPRRLVVLLALLSFLLLAVGWSALNVPRRRTRVAPLLALLPLLAVAPLGAVLGLENLFSPAFFVLPTPGDLTLGRVLALLLPLAALVAAARRPPTVARGLWLPLLLGALAIALAYTGGLQLLAGSATRPLLESEGPLWFGLQLAGVLLLGSLTALAMPRARAARGVPPAPGVLRVLAGSGVLLAALLGWSVAASMDAELPASTRMAALWALPFILVAVGAAFGQGRGHALRRWLLAGWLALTAVLPHLWTSHMEARLASAEQELGTLGSQSDPYLNYLLEELGRQAAARHAAGERGLPLLYRSWVLSGLARESYPAHIAQWSEAGVPLMQLGSYAPFTPREITLLEELVEESRVEGMPAVSSFADHPHVNKVLTVPLGDGQVITVVVPPRRTLDPVSGIALFLGAGTASTTRLNLVPAQEPDSDVHAIQWIRSAAGWRSEKIVQYPDGKYHAHLLVPVPATGVWIARALLLAAFDLAVLLLLWGAGVAARGSWPLPRGAGAAWAGSFRARVTVALFGFFVLPTAAFGYVAYRALAQEVERATEAIAARAARQAVLEFESAGGDLRGLAVLAGADVLRFHRGELLDVSSPEALELGVYGAWMPPAAFRLLETGEEESVIDVQAIGDQRFVTAFHLLQPTGTLGVPMPLVTGDTAIRQRDLSHLILFAVLVGAALSLALSVVVGRALARPIGRLRRAATAVGAGRLGVRLPDAERGEFGQVFRAFNRMVRQLRRARVRERRSARVLAWGEMARQVAHEIKNPLTPIKLAVQHVRRAHRDRHPDFEPILEGSVQEILREIDRLSEIARAFSRYGAPDFAAGPLEAVDLQSVVREALTLYRTSDEPVTYASDVDPALDRVQARSGELKEVLLNLLENARAALDGSGEIIVRALARGPAVVLEVEDDGSGIAPELLERVFDPHFSTRSSGTGLGLAIVRRLVESWGGTVSVSSTAERGTVVRLHLLPAATELSGAGS